MSKDDNRIVVVFTADSEPHESDEQFKKGKAYKMNPASADRWIKRNKAMLEKDYKEKQAAEKSAK